MALVISVTDPCVACGAALATDQRFCLECGHRTLLPWPLEVRAQRSIAPPARPPVRLPGKRLTSALTAAFLLAGVGAGYAAGPQAAGPVVVGRRVVAVVAPPAVAATPPAPAPVADTPSSSSSPSPPAAPVDEASSSSSGASTADEPVPTTPPAADPVEPAATAPSADPEPAPAVPARPKLPKIDHVWVVALAAQGYRDAFGDRAASSYLAHDLRGQGALLTRIDTLSRSAPGNGVALLGGQAPTPEQGAGCIDDTPVVDGHGCVEPATVTTLPGQLTEKGLTWKGYVEGLGPAGCRDEPPALRPRNPFASFASITRDPVCASNVVGLERLAPDLDQADQTPAFSYIVPDACHDGSAAPCSEGAPAGLPAAEPFLRDVVARIQATKAYADGGLIVVLFDGGPPPQEDPRPGQTTGALLVSPFVQPGATIEQHYDPASVLRSFEDLFGLERLGLAAQDGRRSFGPRVFAARSQDVHRSVTKP
jgi:hypothetical protein